MIKLIQDQPRKEKNSFPVAMRRFFREVQQSRILSEAKKRRYFSKDLSRKVKRVIARRKTLVRSLKRGY